MNKFIRALLLAISLLPLTAKAESTIKVYGGGFKCSDWTKDVKDIPTDGKESFFEQALVLGFLSGMAVGRNEDILRDMTVDQVKKWISDYCRTHLQGSLNEASGELYLELTKRKAGSIH